MDFRSFKQLRVPNSNARVKVFKLIWNTDKNKGKKSIVSLYFNDCHVIACSKTVS